MASNWTLIRNGNLLGADDSLGAASLLIKDNLIEQIGRAVGPQLVPRDERDRLRIIDAAGLTVMPGLIDPHCHISYGESRAQEEQDLYNSVESRTLHAAWNAKKVLRAGFTGMSAPGGSYNIGVAIREAIKGGFVEGPRTTTAGRYLSTSNSMTDWYPDPVGVPESSIGLLTNSLPEMMAAVRRQVKAGVDYIKLSGSPFGQYQAFTRDELKGVADLAHQLGTKITVHAVGSAEVDAAIAAGFDWIIHGYAMNDETIGRLAESHIPLIPTLTLLANWADFGDLVGASSDERDGARRVLDGAAISLHKAHQAGVTLLTGTDSGFSITPYGEWHARDLELLTKYAGLSNREAIAAATTSAAGILGLEGRVGALAAGKLADAIIVDGDPLRDIRVLQDKRRILHVIKDGREIEFDDDREARRWPPDRAQIYSRADLTWDLVHEHRPPVSESSGWTREEQHELKKRIRRAEKSAVEAAKG
jgi:imidazolonepropionase-like amidohydrolase